MEHDPLLRTIDGIVQDVQAKNMLIPGRRERIRGEINDLVGRLIGSDWLISETCSLQALFAGSSAPDMPKRAADYRKCLLALLLNGYPEELRAIYVRHP